ncbi:type II toxin-antitoxin system VapC family toxin [Niabella drilacis]|uniref:PIN domain-containing protein n=1 Tax=Niabella drilacis (strain DSM 25811 / CCM 8410 / CCUG 62505 / LMG 26954 / E90) TaxID=1285928 RepID=A0A1G6IUJ8_NIADE|nr:type II toxin-antitoxin system VapC family toxin [Niabella drilacis]SDC09446.1 hypothetical protein SAMN04487894_101315 [Niabella drilacis]
MAHKKLMIDTSILIDYFRKTDKTNSRLVAHFRQYDQIYISTITEFEIFNGATQVHKDFWEGLLSRLIVLSFDRPAARKSAEIVSLLKTKRKTIDKPDLFIAATAITNDLMLDTLNIKHFISIDVLELFTQKNS